MGRELSHCSVLCVLFHWDVTKFDDPEPKVPGIILGYAAETEFSSVAEVFYQGLKDETTPWASDASPWDNWLASNKLTSTEATVAWLKDAVLNDSGTMLVARRAGNMVGLSGYHMLSPTRIGLFTGVVVSKEERRKGVGTLLLYRTLTDAKNKGAKRVEVGTISGIPAAKYLYPKFGGQNGPSKVTLL